MKPPPRTRTKPDRNLKPEPVPQRSGKLAGKWQRPEQRKLLDALKRLSKTAGGLGDIDYAFLRKYVPTRSVAEIHSVVESLKNKVISCASFKLKKKRWEEKKVRKPIEVWTHIASAVAGTLEEPISTAFSQMLLVSSTEPRTLRNRDPPQVQRPPTDEDRPIGRTVPLRPMPRLPVQGMSPGTNKACPLLVLKTPMPTTGPAKRLPAPSQVVRVPNGKIPPPHQQLSNTAGTSSCQSAAAKILTVPSTSPRPASQTLTPIPGQVTPSSSSGAVLKNVCNSINQPSEHHLTTTTTSSSMPTSSISAASISQVPSTAPSCVASSSLTTSSSSSTRSVPPHSTPATAFHARFGRTSKYSTKDSPRMFGIKCVVDFERIYRYLSVIHKPNEECNLTPMESAIVLDLLMSLPEELPLLDCNKLHKHLVQVYQCLSSPADSKIAREMLKDLKGRFCAQTEAPSCQDGTRTNSQQNAAGTADSSDTTDSGVQKLQSEEAECQSSGNNNTSNPSGDADVMGLCPPLNPFMVPLKLLMRR
ncbi:snRNA-activating protein complex subunit 2 isoform X1 [Micropterus salmoides]|uniref:snRNA-activating protein complex subunit 2 isoform X1 n=1 Tax=Micropterus salmoides TaxID=27706 RepID=UPI0018EA5DB7|nr:snRNA-activating protein complex subunit 2 isoform X1 [Micropterus salmoides]